MLSVYILIAGIIVYAIDFVLMIKHCDAGFMGYPDEWDKPTQEKLHYIIAPMSLILLLAALIVCILEELNICLL